MGNVVVAYSGGVDSTLVAAMAHLTLGDKALAVTAASPAVPARELREARALARRSGWNHVVVRTREVEREDYARNDEARCYWCKVELLDVLNPLAARRSAHIVLGTTLDDLGDFRPGLIAADEKGARAPLVEASFTKNDVRALSARLGLPTSDKPAGPCLASRVAYGVHVTAERLRRIDRAEEVLRELGFSTLRVRDHADLARIEVPREQIDRATELRETIAYRLRELGFRFVTLDLEGFRSGSLNEVLAAPVIRGEQRL